jgi:hypothetical protein
VLNLWQGLKANLMRTFQRFSDSLLNGACKSRAHEWRSLLFSIALFHAVIQDRGKFGSLGWNKRYNFTDGDLNVCVTQVNTLLGPNPLSCAANGVASAHHTDTPVLGWQIFLTT